VTKCDSSRRATKRSHPLPLRRHSRYSKAHSALAANVINSVDGRWTRRPVGHCSSRRRRLKLWRRRCSVASVQHRVKRQGARCANAHAAPLSGRSGAARAPCPLQRIVVRPHGHERAMTSVAHTPAIAHTVISHDLQNRRPHRHASAASGYSGAGPERNSQGEPSQPTWRQWRAHISVDTAENTPEHARATTSHLVSSVAFRDGALAIMRMAITLMKTINPTSIASQSGARVHGFRFGPSPRVRTGLPLVRSAQHLVYRQDISLFLRGEGEDVHRAGVRNLSLRIIQSR